MSDQIVWWPRWFATKLVVPNPQNGSYTVIVSFCTNHIPRFTNICVSLLGIIPICIPCAGLSKSIASYRSIFCRQITIPYCPPHRENTSAHFFFISKSLLSGSSILYLLTQKLLLIISPNSLLSTHTIFMSLRASCISDSSTIVHRLTSQPNDQILSSSDSKITKDHFLWMFVGCANANSARESSGVFHTTQKYFILISV